MTQACVGELNTILRGETNYPLIYGIGVNIKTGEIFPATFTDKGPDQNLRQARHFTGGQSVSAGDEELRFYKIKCAMHCIGSGHLRFTIGYASHWPIQL